MTRRVVLAFIAMMVALGGIAAGCGGGGSSSAGSTSTTTTTTGTTPVVEWAGDFCTAVNSWKDDLTAVGTNLGSSPTKDGLQQAADGVKAANQKLADDLKGLGKPDTQSGDKVKQSVDDLTKTLNTQLTTIEDAAKNVSGLSGIVSAGATITASLAAMGTALSTTLNTVENADVKGEMKTAFDQAPSCSNLKSSSG